jgi:23S rRNA (uracil1939-C5)-methyltransferase/tRNA (uracil-5-)-methyltransferase
MGRNKRFNDQPFAYHQEIEIDITTLTNLGSGLGRVPPEPGWVVMVPFALPGERVRARVFRNHKNFSEADLIEVLKPSPERVTPLCPLFGRCGGCQYQHLSTAGQLAWKRRQVAELLEHMAGISFPVEPVIGSPREYGYRSKITPHFNAPLPERAADFPIGFLRQGTRFDLVDVPQCIIATEPINAKLTEVRAATRARAASGEFTRGATLLLREAGGVVATDFDAEIEEQIDLPVSSAARARTPPLPVFPAAKIAAQRSEDSHPAPGSAGIRSVRLRLRFLARDFFQNNPFILPAFIEHVRSEAAASGARYLIDAYCGSGLFALSAASAFERVAGIELSETSVGCARQNAAANGIANATFIAGDAARIFSGLDFPPAETAIIIDPPRKGCDESFLNQLFAFGPQAVVYVSCDPATQMRDLRPFLAAGYRPRRIQPFDLFPQTRHLECVITLESAQSIASD